MEHWLERIKHDGFVLVPDAFTAGQIDAILVGLEAAFQGQDEVARRSECGSVFAARNVLRLWPPATSIWRQGPLPGLLKSCLGPNFGLVRGL
jgi:hypothetical protein